MVRDQHVLERWGHPLREPGQRLVRDRLVLDDRLEDGRVLRTPGDDVELLRPDPIALDRLAERLERKGQERRLGDPGEARFARGQDRADRPHQVAWGERDEPSGGELQDPPVGSP